MADTRSCKKGFSSGDLRAIYDSQIRPLKVRSVPEYMSTIHNPAGACAMSDSRAVDRDRLLPRSASRGTPTIGGALGAVRFLLAGARRTWTAATNPSVPTTARTTCRTFRRIAQARILGHQLRTRIPGRSAGAIGLPQRARHRFGRRQGRARAAPQLPCEVAEVFPFLVAASDAASTTASSRSKSSII